MSGPYRDVEFVVSKEDSEPETVLDVDPPLVFGDDPLSMSETEFWKAVYVARLTTERSGPGAACAADKAVLRLRRRIAMGQK